MALGGAAEVLLGAVLAGAQDEWSHVSHPARTWLAAQAAAPSASGEAGLYQSSPALRSLGFNADVRSVTTRAPQVRQAS